MNSELEDINLPRLLPGENFLDNESMDSNDIPTPGDGSVSVIKANYPKARPVVEVPKPNFTVKSINNFQLRNNMIFVNVVDEGGVNRLIEPKALARENVDLFVDYVLENMYRERK